MTPSPRDPDSSQSLTRHAVSWPEKQTLILKHKICLNLLQSIQFSSVSNQEVAILFHTCDIFSQTPASGLGPVCACRINNENQLNFKLETTSYYRHNIRREKKLLISRNKDILKLSIPTGNNNF